MTIDDLIRASRERLAAKLAERKTATDKIMELRAALDAPSATVTETEVRAAIDARTALDAEIDQLRASEADLVAEKARDEAVNALQREVAPAAPRPAYDQVARVGAEEHTYRKDQDPKGRGFMRDLTASFLNPHSRAAERIQRHARESEVDFGKYFERASTTANFAGLVVPQYLTDLYAPAAAAGRGLANVMRHADLPEVGMTVNISRITTPTAVGQQSSENSPATSQDIDDTLLQVNVLTASGQETLTRQAIDRGVSTEDIMVEDLIRRYHTNLDSQVINLASTGLTNVATAVTWTTGSPTVAGFYPNILNGLSAVEAALLDQASGDNVAVMHSRRWYWAQNAVSNNWPLVQQPGIGIQQWAVNNGNTYGSGFRGNLPNGTPVIVDNNTPTNLGGGTNQDEVYLFDRQQAFLWEDPTAPMFIRAEQPSAANLAVLYVVWGYFAFTFQRYSQAQKISGTGLVTPSFTGS